MMPQPRDRRESTFAGTRSWSPTAGLLLSLMLAATARAQTEPPRPAVSGGAPVPAESATPPVNPPPNVVPNDDIPPYHFSPLKLSGRIDPDGKIARLRAEIEVHINYASGCFDVPLRLTQAAITGIQYQGPFEPIPITPNAPDDGVHWLFQGAGRHLLILDLVVETRLASNGTNLQLTLPSGSKFFPTQVAFTVPLAQVAVEAGPGNVVVTAPSENGETTINATIEGNRIDLTWRALQEQRGNVTRVLTAIAVDSVEDRLRLQATQELVTDGQLTDVRVRLPTGFQLLSLGGRDYGSHALSEPSPGWVDVRLAARDRNQVQLEWLLEDLTPLQPGTLTIDGFDVQGAFGQSGTVGIAPLPGFKVYQLTTESDDGIHREETRRLRAAQGVSQFKWAWRFDRQPLNLSLAVQEERPSFDVRTRAVATTESDRMVLDLEYQIQVHAGRPQEFLLRWPSPGSDGWTLQQSTRDILVSDATDERSQFLGELQRITLPATRDGEFTLRLQYQRPAIPGRFEFGLPRIDADRMLPAWLIVRGVDAVEPQLDESAHLAALTDSSADQWLREQAFNSDRDQAYRVESPQSLISGITNVYPREIRAESVIELTRPEVDAFRIQQQILLDVKYGRLGEWVLTWPKSFPREWRIGGGDAVQCQLASGAPVAVTSDGERLLLTLPEPMLGRIPLTLTYRLPIDAGSNQIAVPVFASPKTTYRSTRVELPESGILQVQPQDQRWKQVPTALRPTWLADGSFDSFEGTLSSDVRAAPQRYLIETAFAQIAFDSAGQSRTAVDYDIRQAPRRVVMQLPAHAEGVIAYWNGAELQEVSINQNSGEGVRVEVPLGPADTRPDGRLRVVYQRHVPSSLDEFREVSVELPELPESVSVGTTFVELGLPSDYCLMTYPDGLTPLFTWRSGLVFQREPTPAYVQWRREFKSASTEQQGGEIRPPSDDGAIGGHEYAFWTAGGTAAIHFRPIRLWALILVGSGLTLTLAFLLWSIQASRNVLTLLTIGVVVAVAGVFASEVVELLLQPVVLGLLSATVAISLQTRRPPAGLGIRDDHSTRSEQLRTPTKAPGAVPSEPVMPTTQIGGRELQESGSRS